MPAQRHVLIVAGGSGQRMGTEVPKQLLPLAGVPVVVRTIRKFIEADQSCRLVVVMGKAWIEHFAQLVEEWELPKGIAIVSGGGSRFESVKNGLRILAGADGLVAVHDAVRPLVSGGLINTVFQACEKEGSAIPTVSVTESVRQVTAAGSVRVDRGSLRLVQTPQCFKLEELHEAYEQPYEDSFTDCATVMEKAGFNLHFVNGEPTNIKLTTREDLHYAQWRITFREEP